MRAIANEFVEDAGDEGESFGVVQAHAAGESALGEGAGLCDEELVDLCIMMSRWRFEVRKVNWGNVGLPPSVPTAWLLKTRLLR